MFSSLSGPPLIQTQPATTHHHHCRIPPPPAGDGEGVQPVPDGADVDDEDEGCGLHLTVEIVVATDVIGPPLTLCAVGATSIDGAPREKFAGVPFLGGLPKLVLFLDRICCLCVERNRLSCLSDVW